MECLPKGIDDKNSKSAQALELIERIFAADKGFEAMPTDEIYAKRQEILKPLFDEYWKLLETIDAPKGSNLYKAVVYSVNQKQMLNALLFDGRLELTNNRAERAIKPFVIVMGRKTGSFRTPTKVPMPVQEATASSNQPN